MVIIGFLNQIIIKMNNTVLLSLFSRKTHLTGKNSPKNYPFYLELVELLKKNNYHTVQLSLKEEPDINADIRYNNLSFPELKDLLFSSFYSICVDNFWQHFANFYDKRCIVLWSQSMPVLFGYKNNINLYNDKKLFRPRKRQFHFWEEVEYDVRNFVKPERVLEEVNKIRDSLFK